MHPRVRSEEDNTSDGSETDDVGNEEYVWAPSCTRLREDFGTSLCFAPWKPRFEASGTDSERDAFECVATVGRL
jgi:hypothetical protein